MNGPEDHAQAWHSVDWGKANCLNPIIEGWAAYCRTVVSKTTFRSLDKHVWTLPSKWGRHTHSLKPKNRVVARCFAEVNSTRRDEWVFGDRASGRHRCKSAWTRIDRHVMIKGAKFPDDPRLAGYWAIRRRGSLPSLVDRTTITLAARPKGDLPVV